MSLQSGIFPDKLKIAKVVPIFKAGEDNINSYVHNYRQISLQSCFSKIIERVVYNELYNNLQLNKLLAFFLDLSKAFDTIDHNKCSFKNNSSQNSIDQISPNKLY